VDWLLELVVSEVDDRDVDEIVDVEDIDVVLDNDEELEETPPTDDEEELD
jgi:hypothetical protein